MAWVPDCCGAGGYEVRSNPYGQYTFAGVLPADYTLELKQPGFETVREPLSVAGTTTRDVVMTVGTLQETITVRGATPAGNPASLSDLRAKAREQFDWWAERGKDACRASGPPAVGGNIMPPRKLVDVRPVYPPELLAAGTGGSVTFTAVIGADGTVREIADARGPNSALEAAAADAVRGWQFSQTFLNCEPIRGEDDGHDEFRALVLVHTRRAAGLSDAHLRPGRGWARSNAR